MQIQQTLEEDIFLIWGLPQKIRVDNGHPFGVPERTSISPLSLWLTGLGIQMHFNRPRVPQENAKVERNQGTTSKWSDYSKCTDYKQLQRALNKAITIQRDKYPLDRHGFKTRKELYPQIYCNSKQYNATDFSIEKVLKTLSEHSYVRKVSKNNQFTFYGVQPSIPKGYAHQDIIIKLDFTSNVWQIFDKNGNRITQIHNNFITHENVLNLSICQRTNQ